jgi:predicted TIM-barrel fold metal-dependent hydrolase
VIIDWHSHWIPPALLARVAGLRQQELAPEFSDLEARLRHMDEAGVTRQVISWPTTFGFDALLPLAELTAFYRQFNDRLGELLARHPDRFSGLAAVPALDPEAAAAELTRAQAACGTIGAVIPADAFLTEKGAELYRPLLAQAQALRSHLYVHPGPTGLKVPAHVPIEFLRTDRGSARWLLESGTRLGAAALTLETSPFLGGYPGVTVHVSMLGGHLPWIAETLALREKAAPAGPLWPLRKIYVDTGILKPGGLAIAHAVAVFGADRILFGSDFPQFGTRRPGDAFLESGLPLENREQILFRNGETLLAAR